MSNELQVGDFFAYPTGNARYGGLRIGIGLVIGQTAKRYKVLLCDKLEDWEPKDFKTSSITGTRVLRLTGFAHEDLYKALKAYAMNN